MDGKGESTFVLEFALEALAGPPRALETPDLELFDVEVVYFEE